MSQRSLQPNKCEWSYDPDVQCSKSATIEVNIFSQGGYRYCDKHGKQVVVTLNSANIECNTKSLLKVAK